jgi:hypothetical protein
MKYTMMILLMGCVSPPPTKNVQTFSEKRFECIDKFMNKYKEFSNLLDITNTCKQIIICKECDK